MLRPTFTVLVALATFTGCLGADEDVPLEPASTVDVPGSDGTVEPSVTEAAAIVPVATAIAYSGKTPTGACAFIVGQCHWAAAGSEDYHVIEPQGQATHLSIAITYGEQAPGMSFYGALCVGETEGETCTEYTTGPSPLVLEFDLDAYEPGALFGISLGSVNDAAAASGTLLFGAADFDVQGTLTSIPIV